MNISAITLQAIANEWAGRLEDKGDYLMNDLTPGYYAAAEDLRKIGQELVDKALDTSV